MQTTAQHTFDMMNAPLWWLPLEAEISDIGSGMMLVYDGTGPIPILLGAQTIFEPYHIGGCI